MRLQLHARLLPLAPLLVVVGLLLSGPSCAGTAAAKPPNLSPAASTAWDKLAIQKPLDTIRDLAQDGNALTPPVFSTTTVRSITQWHEAALKIINTLGTGWKNQLTTSLQTLLRTLPVAEAAKLSPYATLVQTVLQEIP